MNVLESAQNLVEKVLEVGVGEWLLGANDLMDVCLHEFLHDVAGCARARV